MWPQLLKILFYIGNVLNLAHFSEAPKFYNVPISLNVVWPRLPPKYFGKLKQKYQLNIVRLHLWKIGVCSSWGELRSHYSVFLGVWLPFPPKNVDKFHNFLVTFVVGTLSWKCEACSWWVGMYPEMDPICLIPGLNFTQFRITDQMDFSPLANPNIFGALNFLRKTGWNYPSGALCL